MCTAVLGEVPHLNAWSATKHDTILSSFNHYSRCCVSCRPKPRGHELPSCADFYPDVTDWDNSIPVQTSAESGAVAGSATNPSMPHFFGASILQTTPFLPGDRILQSPRNPCLPRFKGLRVRAGTLDLGLLSGNWRWAETMQRLNKR